MAVADKPSADADKPSADAGEPPRSPSPASSWRPSFEWTASQSELMSSLTPDDRRSLEKSVDDAARDLALRVAEEEERSSSSSTSDGAAVVAKVRRHAERKMSLIAERAIRRREAELIQTRNDEREARVEASTRTEEEDDGDGEGERRTIAEDPYRVLRLVLPGEGGKASKAEFDQCDDDDDDGDASSNAAPLPTPGDWASAFDDPTLPLVVDVGCGSGQWILRAAYEEEMQVCRRADAGGCGEETAVPRPRRRNYLGVEIREGLVRTALRFRDRVGAQIRRSEGGGTNAAGGVGRGGLEGRVAFWHGEVDGAYWDEFVGSYGPGPVELFCCQLPDPRLDKNLRRGKGSRRRGKGKAGGKTRGLLTEKRIVRPELARAVVSSLLKTGREGVEPENESEGYGGIVYLSSDYLEVAEEMRDIFLQDDRVAPVSGEGVLAIKLLPGGPVDTGSGSTDTTDATAGAGAGAGATPGAGDDGPPSSHPPWLPYNPFNLPTEREIRLAQMSGAKGRRVYRLALRV